MTKRTNNEETKNNITKLSAEILPLIVFFTLYKFKDMIYATTGLLITTIVVNLFKYYIERKISLISIISSLILIIFSCLTIYTKDASFIKMKVTFINIIFALILYIGTIYNVGLIKYVYAEIIELTEIQWIKISRQWAIFFTIMAIVNELIWRNVVENIWVKFKVFGIIPLTIIFSITQLHSAMKNKSR